MGNRSPAPGATPKQISNVVQWAAILLIAAWLTVLLWLGYFHLKDEEIQWTRLTYLLNSLEAVVFAAAGALFGTQVQRARVEKAEKTAKKGVKLAELVRDSSPEMRSIFESGQLNITNSGTKALVQGEMKALAEQIIADEQGL